MAINNPFSLEGKTILVTGASSGIGQTIAIECSKMGANLVVNGRNEERLNQTAADIGHNACQQIMADLTMNADLEKLVEEVPQLDGLVLCAGKAWTMPVKMASSDKLLDVFNTNFVAQTELLRLLFKKKKLNNAASVVIISSVGGNYVFETGQVMYGVSKAALNSYMRFAANEFAARKVRVNCICPGMIDTPMIHRGTFTDEQLQTYLEKYPLGRFGKPEDVAYASIYLLSNAAEWVTGTTIVVDGGSSNK